MDERVGQQNDRCGGGEGRGGVAGVYGVAASGGAEDDDGSLRSDRGWHGFRGGQEQPGSTVTLKR